MKRTMFKKIVDWTENIDFCGMEGHRVRVTDAREMTVERAIAETLNKTVWIDEGYTGQMRAKHLPAGYSACVRNGKVIVRKIKGEKQ